jgi:hypothetical protein
MTKIVAMIIDIAHCNTTSSALVADPPPNADFPIDGLQDDRWYRVVNQTRAADIDRAGDEAAKQIGATIDRALR